MRASERRRLRPQGTASDSTIGDRSRKEQTP